MGCQNILRVKRKCETFTSLHFLEQAPYFLAIIPQKSVKYFGGDMKDAHFYRRSFDLFLPTGFKAEKLSINIISA